MDQYIASKKNDYEGFFTKPMTFKQAFDKFSVLAKRYTDKDLRQEIAQKVQELEKINIRDLTKSISLVR